MAIAIAPVADGKNTAWNTFKNQVKSDLNYAKTYLKNTDFSRNGRSLQLMTLLLCARYSCSVV